MTADLSFPHSPAAERAIVAAIVENGAEAIGVSLENGIAHASFHSSANGRVFVEVMAMHAEGKPVAIATVAERLEARGILAEIGGWPAFAAMTDDPPLSTELAAFCRELVALDTRRTIIRVAAALGEAATANPDAVPEILARLLETQTHATARRTWKKVVGVAAQRAEDIIAGREPDAGATLSFGFVDLDRTFRPMRRGEMAVIAARPSCGKSSLMRQIVAANAKAGANVLVESLEVSADDIADSLAATLSGVSRRDLSRAHPSDQRDYLAAARALDLDYLHVFDCDRTLAAIVARAKAIHASRPIDLVAIDYLGLIRDCEAARGETKAAAIGRVTKALKSLAMELDCVILLLAQLNRQSVTDGNREPRLSDLRDSGDIEQDADRVIFIHRPDADPLTGTDQRDTDSLSERPRFFQNVVQAKGRNVGTGIVSFYFRRAITRFEAVDRRSAT
jgi:replicative DNA helicase